MQAQPWSNQILQNETLPLTSNSAFLYLHNPKNWELYYYNVPTTTKRKKTQKKPILLPSFSALQITGGVNGVRDGARPDPSVAIAKYRRSGVTVILPEDHDYIRVYKGRRGNYHTDKWTKITVLGGECIFEFDHDGFAKFRIDLIKKNVIDLPHNHFIQLLQMELQRSVDRLALDQHIPERAIKLKKKQQDLAAIIEFKNLLKEKGIKAYENE